MASTKEKYYQPIKFFILVFILSVPFWILGAVTDDLTKKLPINLPISALMAFCPLLAAAILVYKKSKQHGVKELMTLSFDFKKIRDKRWYVPIVFLMPVLALLSYWYVKTTGATLSESTISRLSVFIFFLVYFVGAAGEELGWSGYVIYPLQNRYGALRASIILGFVWAMWHIIPWSQAHQNTNWIVWQLLSTVLLRVIMVWLFNNTGKSVFAMVLFHTMINISPYFIPNYGSNYSPFIFCILLIITAFIICLLWDGKTLVRYKFS